MKHIHCITLPVFTLPVLAAGVLLVGCENGPTARPAAAESEPMRSQRATPTTDAQSAATPPQAAQKPTGQPAAARAGDPDPTSQEKIMKSNEEWSCQLSPEQFHVTREKGTERAFTGRFWNHNADGVYVCICCGHPLFDSQTKFDSGTGWPSFTRPAADEAVAEHRDTSHGMVRTEVVCAKCDAHLGHVFDDGPPPTRLRYCINSASLDFSERKKPAEE